MTEVVASGLEELRTAISGAVIGRDDPEYDAARALYNAMIDKRPEREWPREKAQCVIVHEYGHLAGRKHSKNPRSIMYPTLRYRPCHRWLVRHGIR